MRKSIFNFNKFYTFTYLITDFKTINNIGHNIISAKNILAFLGLTKSRERAVV